VAEDDVDVLILDVRMLFNSPPRSGSVGSWSGRGEGGRQCVTTFCQLNYGVACRQSFPLILRTQVSALIY